MKDFFKNGAMILLVIAVLYIIFLRECKKPDPCPPENQVLIQQSTWDSILALADKPPIIHIDTVYIKGETIYVDVPIPGPQPDPQDSTINVYSDSLVKEDIDVHIQFKVRGQLLDRSWQYKPIQTVVTVEKTIYVPKIIIEERIVTQPINGLYGYGTAGGNANAFLFGGGIDYITKKDTEIGYMYQRFGSDNFHSVKLGGRIFKRRAP